MTTYFPLNATTLQTAEREVLHNSGPRQGACIGSWRLGSGTLGPLIGIKSGDGENEARCGEQREGVYFEGLWSQGMGWEVTVSWYLGLWIIIVNDLESSVL